MRRATPLRMRASIIGLAAALLCVDGLNNGVGRTPALGFSSWNAFSADVNSATMRQIVNLMISSGLAAKNFTYVNIDEGWLEGRYPNGTIYENRTKFPEGMKAFGDWVHAQETAPGSGKFMKFGLYTCRGTCQCSEPDYHGPGSQDHEKADVDWMVNAGADYLKVDSCCASQDHKTAFTQYGLFRDALNATGREVYLSLCGWNEWYAPPDPSVGYLGGNSLGNSWRIAGDGDTWPALTNCFNTIARVRQYSGPGGWADPDLLIGPNGVADGTYATDLQARTQVNLWSVISAPLLISNNLLKASQYNIDSYGNTEVIAVNQDPLGIPGFRVVGGDLKYPCGGDVPAPAKYAVEALACNASDPRQRWVSNGNGSSIALAGDASTVLDGWQCSTADNTPVYGAPPDGAGAKCAGRNQNWSWRPDGTIVNVNSNTCLDVYNYNGPNVDLWTCNGGANQKWSLTPEGLLQSAQTFTPRLCAAAVTPAAAACTNVWARPLVDGSVAFVFVNNGAANATVTCDAACFSAMNVTGSGSVSIRDLWEHAVVATLTPPYTYNAMVQGEGGSVIVRAIKA